MTDLSADRIGLQPAASGDAQTRAAACACEWKYCLGVVVILGAAYLLMASGRWHPGPDTAYYISVSRSLAQGHGFVFNGIPVGRIPPLWPLVLAGAMKITPEFWFLNLIPTVCLLGASAIWYWVMRRLTTPRKAFWATILTGIGFHVFTTAVQLRTEALFCLLFSAAMLLAMQVGEGRASWWRIIAAAVLCGLMVGVRWAGLTCWLPVAATMLMGQTRPQQNRAWMGAALVGVMAVVSFVGIRAALKADWSMASAPVEGGQEQRVVTNNGDAASEVEEPTGGGKTPRWARDQRETSLPDDMDNPPVPFMQAVFTFPGLAATIGRIGDAGKWISSVLCMPAFAGVTARAIGWFVNPVGWFLIVLFGICMWTQARRRQWVWVGVLLYCGALVLRWRQPNPRYLVPVAPLLLLGVWLGLEHLAISSRKIGWQRFWRFGVAAYIAVLVVCNVALWGVEVYVSRSNDFYANYWGGDLDDMIAAARQLREHGVGDGQVAVSYHYINLERTRKNGNALRAMHLLTTNGMRSVPKKVCVGEPNDLLLEWASKWGVKYYLYRPPVSPWRAHHFRLEWYQRWRTGEEVPHNPSWLLYELSDTAVPVQVQHVSDWPKRVPGM